MTVGPVFQSPPALRRIDCSAKPLDVYERLYAGQSYSFLYESLGETRTGARYSFTGGRPRLVFQSKGKRIHLREGSQTRDLIGDPIEMLRQLVGPPMDLPAIAPFCGGAVGYLGYEMVRFFETLPDDNPDDLRLPDSFFIFPEELVVFDHAAGEACIIVYAQEDATQRLDLMQRALSECAGAGGAGVQPGITTAHQSGLEVQDASRTTAPEDGQNDLCFPRTTEEEFTTAVNRAKEYIRAGDIFQVVLSRRFDFSVTSPPLTLYKALRRTNPSPYAYFLNFGDVQVLGSSPEVLVQLEGRRVMMRPLAGTRPRGADARQDRLHQQDLLSDEKERAEHVMLVDLARNDLGRVCSLGTVQTTKLLQVERYAHVHHLVSQVEGRLAEDCDAFDVLRASFPAGTVSGAPKIRAMEIIDELETVKRGVYAGAIGYFSLRGDMDLCIAIRTIVLHGQRGSIQAGAGIVADSVPEREVQETLMKAKGLIQAVNAVQGTGGRISC
ncbi:MAG: anthranilate synthase component I [Planctomycetes bacterium]|nr:anthranilate synthase component I [Planctomycetota bacterium]